MDRYLAIDSGKNATKVAIYDPRKILRRNLPSLLRSEMVISVMILLNQEHFWRKWMEKYTKSEKVPNSTPNLKHQR